MSESINKKMALRGQLIKSARMHLKLNQSELGKLIGVDRVSVSYWENAKITDIKPKYIKKLSETLGIDIDVLAIQDDSAEVALKGHGDGRIAESDNIYQLSEYREKIIEIPIFTAPFAMGSGIVENLDHHVIVSNLKITRKFIRENVSVQTTPDNLRIVTGLGDSMSPTFNDGDQLFLDTGVKDVEVDAIYAFEYKAQFFIKRLQRMPGGLIEAHSDSNNYNTFKIEKKHRDSFNIYGRIVGIWNFRKI